MSKTPTPHPLTETKAWRARQAIGTIVEEVAACGQEARLELDQSIASPQYSRRYIWSIKASLRDCKLACTRALKAIEHFERNNQTK